MTKAYLPVISDTGLSQYMTEIKKFPILTLEQEQDLANRWVENEDIDAAHELVTSHLRLVVKIAMGFRGYGLPVPELISEGNIGLMQAVKRFEPAKGFRLATYAMWWIKASINEYVLRSWSMVKMGTTAAQKKLFFNLKRSKARITGMDSRVLTPAEITQIAKELDVPERDVIEMDQRMTANDSSLNAHFSQEDDSGEWIDFLEDETQNQEADLIEYDEFSQRKALMEKAMEDLNDREKDIIVQRRLAEPAVTLEELSKKYEVSRERIRQIENRALEKLKDAMLPKALPAA